MKKRPHKKLISSAFQALIFRSGIISLLLTFFSLEIYANDNQWHVIKSGQFEGLATLSGEIIIPAVYDEIGWSDGSESVFEKVIGYKEGENWGLISLKNKRLTDPQFELILPLSSGKIKAAIKGKFSNHLFYGLLSNKGQVLIGFDNFSIDVFNEFFLLVSEYRNRKVLYGLIDFEDKTILLRNYTSINLLGNIIQAQNGDKIKLFTSTGESIFDAWVDTIEVHDFGYLITKDGKYGQITKDGAIKYGLDYKEITEDRTTPFNRWKVINQIDDLEKEIACDSLRFISDDSWIVYNNHHSKFLNLIADKEFDKRKGELVAIKKGHLIFQNQQTLKWSVFKDRGDMLLKGKDEIVLDSNYMYVQKDNRWNIYNYFGRQVNQRSLADIIGEQDKYVAVKNHGYWGWMDFSGKMIVNFRYDQVSRGILKDQFMVKYVDKWGLANFSNHFLISPNYDKIEQRGSLYVAYLGRSKHIFSKEGKLLYTTADDVSGDKLLVIKNQLLFGAILPNGFLVEPEYDSVWETSGYYQFRYGDLIRLIDSSGRQIIGFNDSIQEVGAFSEEYFLIKREEQFGFIDKAGKLRIANRYDEAKTFSDGLAAIKLIGKWGFINKEEKLKVQPFYDYVGDFQNGLAIVMTDNHWGIINKNGNEVVKTVWKEIIRQSTGNFVAKDFEKKKGLVNGNGEIIMSPLFDDLVDLGSKEVIATRYGKKGVLDYSGFTQYSFEYDDIQIQENYVILLKEK